MISKPSGMSMVSLVASDVTMQRSARMTITNVETAELIEAQFNPDELKEKLEAMYNEPEIVGHSHQPLQYKGTKNLVLSFTMTLDGLSARDNADGNKLDDHRRFILSLFFPQRDGSGTPRVLLVWPKLYSMICRATVLDGTHKRMALDGRSTLYDMAITWKVVLLNKVYSEDVRIAGTQWS